MVSCWSYSVFRKVAVIAPLYCSWRLGLLNSSGADLRTRLLPPFAIWILRNYMLGIRRRWRRRPVDGPGTRTVWSIVCAGPAWPVHGGHLHLHRCWTEFLMALTFDIQKLPDHPGGHRRLRRELLSPYGTFRGQRRGGGAIGLLVFIFRSSLVSGLTWAR